MKGQNNSTPTTSDPVYQVEKAKQEPIQNQVIEQMEDGASELLDGQTEKPKQPVEKEEQTVAVAQQSKTDEIGVEELVKKELQEASIEELGQKLDKLIADHPDFKIAINNMAAEVIWERAHDIVTSPNFTLTEVETLLNNLYDQGLISDKNRIDLVLDYIDSYIKRSAKENPEVISAPVKEVIVVQEPREILSANSPLTEDEINKLREYVKYVQKSEPYKENSVRDMVADRVIAPIIIEDSQSKNGQERLQ